MATRWQTDEYTGGTHSFVQAGGSPDDYDILAAPVGSQLHFAGEATHK